MWVPWVKINTEWFRFEPTNEWISALDTACTAVLKHGKQRFANGVKIVVLWDGWGDANGPCSWGIPGETEPTASDLEVAAENYASGAPDP